MTETDNKNKRDKEPKLDLFKLPIMPTRNLVMFPEVIFPISLVREHSRKMAAEAESENRIIGVVCQRDPNVDNPKPEDLCSYGVAVQVLKVVTLPDNNQVALVRGIERFKILKASTEPAPDIIAEIRPDSETNLSLDSTASTVLESCENIIKELSDTGMLPAVMAQVVEQGAPMQPSKTVNSLCVNSPLPAAQRQLLLEKDSVRKRLMALHEMLVAYRENQRIMAEIEERTKAKIGERARDQFLETKIEELKAELYGTPQDETDTFRRTLQDLGLPEDTTQTIEAEIAKLERMNPQSPDYQTQHSYLRTLFDLPWGKYTDDNTDFTAAKQALETTHSGMEKVKERVLEHLAVMMHTPSSQSPILCLVGPPGVGKTSLGQTIADAMGRQFRRVSLGGLHDESEIRGHRRTYIGAMPGRIIEAVKRAGTMNPIIMLDEIDKVGADYKGDPSAALLEVLDPEQNSKFHDNYLDIDFDLSRVMFITTANTLSPIPSPLLDRMEIISLSGYTSQEKADIALQHLIPSLRRQMQLSQQQFDISDDALSALIDNYTSESGVRQLQKRLAQLMRKSILASISKQPVADTITPDNLRPMLGPAQVSRDKYGTDGLPGVVTGLAWTAAGGEVLYIETALTQGKEKGQLSLTGNLGDVMKESAAMAHRYIQSHYTALNISAEALEQNIHIHVPEGAIPKDGPSAGITITVAMVSALTQRPVRQGVAMTGEMTLRGRVLPVGGIKEKMLAAKRAGISEIILSENNRDNVEEIPEKYRQGLTFHYVSTALEAIAIALQ